MNEERIRDWFSGLKDFLAKEHNLNANEFLATENSSRIFNLDESGFPLQGTNGKLKVIAGKG